MTITPAAALGSILSARTDRILVCYLPVGDPLATCATPAFYADHGVDVVEAGVAVADPVLDGPEVTESMSRAITAGVVDDVAADTLGEGLASARGVGCVWMSYRTDPDDDYLARVRSSGAGGVLLPDADQSELDRRAKSFGLAAIPFVDHVPTDPQVQVAVRASGYVMLAAATGVTGQRAMVAADNEQVITGLRERGVTAPILLGFGLSRPDHVRAALAFGADGVIVGSACVRAARQGRAELSALLTDLREALDVA